MISYRLMIRFRRMILFLRLPKKQRLIWTHLTTRCPILSIRRQKPLQAMTSWILTQAILLRLPQQPQPLPQPLPMLPRLKFRLMISRWIRLRLKKLRLCWMLPKCLNLPPI